MKYGITHEDLVETCPPEILAAHDARVTELLNANNAEVERRREAEKRVKALKALLTEVRDTGYLKDDGLWARVAAAVGGSC